MTVPSTRTLITAWIVIVVVAALGGGGWWWYSAQQRKVQAAWAQVETQLIGLRTAQTTPEQRTAAIREVEQFLAQHPSSSLSALAAYDLGNLRFASGEYAPARVAYETALARGPSPTLKTLARSGIAAAWEAERDFARAAELYQRLLAGLKPRDFLYEGTLLDLARAQLLAGRRDQAVESYRRLLTELPTSARADEARARLASLAVSN